MKIATTIGDMYRYSKSPAEAVRMFAGSGFQYLDYAFSCSITDPNDPWLSENWKEEIYACKDAAEELGFSFVQAHAPMNATRGETLELVGPDFRPRPVCAEQLWDAEGTPVEELRTPQTVFRMPLPPDTPAYSILRRNAERDT